MEKKRRPFKTKNNDVSFLRLVASLEIMLHFVGFKIKKNNEEGVHDEVSGTRRP